MGTKRLRLLSLFISLFIVFSVCFVLMQTNQHKKVYASNLVIEDWTQQDGALLGDILEVPESVKLQIDEDTFIEADSGIIYYPDGNARELGPKLLDMVGKYTLRYQAKDGEKTYYGEKGFFVEESNYYVSNNIFSSANFVSAENLKYGDKLKNKADGIEVTLSKGNYFRFNQPINIYEVAEKNGGLVNVSLAYPVMDTSLVSNDAITDKNGNVTGYWGSRLGSYFTIKLIDCYDESNFIEFYQWSNQSKQAGIRETCCGAGHSGEQFSRLKSGSGISATVNIDGKTYIPIYRDRYQEGSPYSAGIYGYSNTYSLYSNGAGSFKLNVYTNEIYYGSTFLTDVDHPQVYTEKPFKGFTTGEVYVQYSFENSWTSSAMELYIQSILGLSGEELQKVAVSDVKMPEVEIDVQYTDEAEKSINVTYNKEFTLPTANVYDVNGENEYKLAVYYDYYTDNPKTVYLKNGKFTPDKLGVIYTAVYLAQDRFGNSNIDSNGKCIDVINMIPTKGNALIYNEEKIDELNSCTINYLPKIDVISVNKEPKISVFVVSPSGERKDITDTFDGENYSYIPEYIGTHTIEYLFEDNIYSEKFSYTVNSLDLSNVLFVDKIALPSVFIKDAIYDLDDYFAYVATQNGLSKHTAKLLVSVDGEDFIEIQNQHRFKVEGNESLSFKAEYLGKQTEIQTCKITDVNFNHNPNVNNGSKLYQNYFVGFDSVEFTDSYIDYKFNGNKSELFQFATPLVFDSFRFDFEIPTESVDKLSSINIILKEISGKDSGYVISYNKTSSSTSFYFSIKGIDGVTYFANSVSGSFGGAHFIIISNSNVTTSENIAISLPGVSSRNVEFSVSMPDTTGEFSFYVKNVGGTIFSKYIYEKSPELIYRRPYGYPQVGVEYVLPTFNISSVFYPISLDNLKYSYRDNNGNYLLDANGNEIKDISGNAPAITILPKEVKYYRLEIIYDNFGQYLFVQDVGNFIVSVIDMVAPKTTFNDGSNENTVVNLKLGSNHKFKKFKVVDDVTISDNLIVKIVVMDESGAILAWGAKDSYRFSKAGKYKVVVFAQDENGNASKTYYNVLVK